MTNQTLSTPDDYIAFDAGSLKRQTNRRLVQSGLITDSTFVGSNISVITDIIALAFQNLMYYLNKTSNESMFSNAQLYENMNRIVKVLDYRPIGFQTSTLSFTASAANLAKDLYTIPRYSFITAGGIPYSFNEDITFAKTIDSVVEELAELSKQKLLFQGKFVEYPLYSATGEDNETMYLVIGDTEIVDHFNINVFVKDINGQWQEYERTPSLYLEDAFAQKYEIRLNENKRYEIKFGNNINGRKLDAGEQVAVYYLQSSGPGGEVGVGALFGNRMFRYNTAQVQEILNSIVGSQYNFLTNPDLENLSFNNSTVSTYVNSGETAVDIKLNAPSTFRSQYRLVTDNDYTTFIKTNFANLVHDVKVVNNTTYLTENLKYYYNLGIANPSKESRVLYNQVNFSDTCNFNNVYVIAVPKVAHTQTQNIYLSPSQKELITSSMKAEKTLTAEIVIIDPVYVAVSVVLGDNITTPTIADVAKSTLIIVKDQSVRRDNTSIKAEVRNIFSSYFSRSQTHLGQIIDLNKLTADLLSIDGVQTFYTARTDSSIKYEGLSLMVWNPVYNDIDSILTFKNLTLPYFKCPYFDNLDTFVNKIQISGSHTFENIDY